jgi:hypothetical protein
MPRLSAINSLKIWSEVGQAVVDWNVMLENEKDENGNYILGQEVIVARYGDEFHKFSPNCTDEELSKRAEEMNEGKT